MMKLIIVDDRAGSRDMIRKMFTSPQVAIRECTCLEEAVRVAREFKPDWITMDIQTTRIESLAAIAVLRTEHPAVRLAIIVGHDQPAPLSRAKEPGSTIFVHRPNLHLLPALLATAGGGRESASGAA